MVRYSWGISNLELEYTVSSAVSSPPDKPGDTRMNLPGPRLPVPASPRQMPPHGAVKDTKITQPPPTEADVLYNILHDNMTTETMLRALSQEDAVEKGYSQQALLFLMHQQLEQIVGRWQVAPKATYRDKVTLNGPGQPTPIKTNGMRYISMFCPGAVPIVLVVEDGGMQATISLNPGWQRISITDQSMMWLAAGQTFGVTFEIELSDIEPAIVTNQGTTNGLYVNGVGFITPGGRPTATDTNGVKSGEMLISIDNVNGSVNFIGNNNNAFWSAAVLGAGVTSQSVSINGAGKVRIFVTTSVADTFNVQISDDGGTTWYTLTQDNAGTPVIIATTATQLSSCRDISTFGWSSIRLLNISAATVTAGYQTATF